MCQSHRFFYSTFLFIDISIQRPSQVQVIVPYLIYCTQDSKYHRQGKTCAHRAPRADGQNGPFGEQPRVPLPSLQISGRSRGSVGSGAYVVGGDSPAPLTTPPTPSRGWGAADGGATLRQLDYRVSTAHPSILGRERAYFYHSCQLFNQRHRSAFFTFRHPTLHTR